MENTFDEKTIKAQKCAVKKDWKGFKEVFEKEGHEERVRRLLEPFDLFGNTAIHAATRSGNAKLLQELLNMLPDETHRSEALRKKNREGNTLLHEAALNKDLTTVDTILEFGQKLLQDGYQEPRTDPYDLLVLQNTTNETPIFRAAKYGNLDMLKHIHAKYPPLRAEHFPPSLISGRHRPILHNCLLTFNFGVAIWLVKKVDENLGREKYKIGNGKQTTEEKNELGFTCFQLLSKMPMAFASKETLEMGMTEKLIYYMLPEEGYESELELELDDAGNNSFKSTTDIESGPPDAVIEKSPCKSICSSLNYRVWKLLARGFRCIEKIWNQKKKHKFAVSLAKLLVKINRDSRKYAHWKGDQALYIFPDFPSNVTEKKKEIELEHSLHNKEQIKRKMNPMVKVAEELAKEAVKNETSWETPLFLAAASGIKEVVEIVVDDYPEAISHVNENGLNILHVAIRHRQLEIYEYIVKSPAFKSLVPRICDKGRTILHQAASMEYYREQSLPGVAYQLQDELDWYHQVRSNLPDHYIMHCDKEGLTAGDLLDIEHAEMHDQAKQWMKETAQSCSTVAVLIAGVVFAAAYAIPGGSEGGKPVLHSSSAFRIFTVMDVVALACSLGSVVMFLSILTSSFDLWDFHKSLPRKLKLGFLMLFCALITTMLAFAATILLTIRMEGNKKTTTFIYSLAFVIVSIFGLTQFPLYKMIEDQVKQCLKFWKKKREVIH